MLDLYEEALTWLYSLKGRKDNKGIERVTWFLEKVGNPHKCIKTIHVTGTNGKGSTVAFMRSLLQESGERVGTFTSPFIQCFNERIAINGEFIKDHELLQLIERIKPLYQKLLKTKLGAASQFEVVTVMMFMYFAKEDVDVALIEVGIGGRYDATNVITPVVSIITSIDFDHMGILGNTLEQIAFHKVGIIKANIPTVTTVESSKMLKVIEEEARMKNSKVYRYGNAFKVKYCNREEQEVTNSIDEAWEEIFDFESDDLMLKEIKLSLVGKHQIKNAAIALQAILLYWASVNRNLNENDIRMAFRKTTWAGRMEKISDSPKIILDGAHNEAGIDTLVQTLQERYPKRRIYILFSALHEKSYEKMLMKLLTLEQTQIVTTTFESLKGALTMQGLERIMLQERYKERLEFIENDKRAIEEVLGRMEENELLVITGSLYFISDVRAYLLEHLNNNSN